MLGSKYNILIHINGVKQIMKITISRTIQVKQYEPLVVTVEEEGKVDTNEEYQELKNKVSAVVEDIIATEVAKARGTH